MIASAEPILRCPRCGHDWLNPDRLEYWCSFPGCGWRGTRDELASEPAEAAEWEVEVEYSYTETETDTVKVRAHSREEAEEHAEARVRELHADLDDLTVNGAWGYPAESTRQGALL